MNPYDEAHLFVAAIRILQHKKNSAPPIEEVCELISISVEAGLSVSRKLRMDARRTLYMVQARVQYAK